MDPRSLAVPIVQAPLSGGPSTPRLAAAVLGAGGLGFLATGYKTADAVAKDVAELRSLTDAPFGVNLFAASATPADTEGVRSYATSLRGEAERYGVRMGQPRHDDDGFNEKLDLLVSERVALVSFTFGCPHADVFTRLRDAGIGAWVTVTSVAEAALARTAGADALVVQGFEAGGHRGYFVDGAEAEEIGLLSLLRLIAARVPLPLVASGGIADGAALAAVLSAGAAAAQIGTAFMLTPEAGTGDVQRAALRGGGRTALTRAFTGRRARGIVNRFMAEHEADAPVAYPDVHHLTAPIRAAARAAGDPGAINLWAGQTHVLAREEPAAEVVARLVREAREAAAAAAGRLGP